MLCRNQKKQIMIDKQNTDSLQVYQTMNSKASICDRVSVCTSDLRGSLTVEASFSAFFFLLTVIILISLIDIFRVWSNVTVSLNESAKKLGMYAYATEADEGGSPLGTIESGVCIAYAHSRLPKENRADISLLGSSYKNHRVDLKARIKYRFPVRFFTIDYITFYSRARVHAWTGYSGDEEGKSDDGGEMVYVTDRQTVYHTYGDCSHLDISVLCIGRGELHRKRNQYGSKYAPCPHCKPGYDDRVLYITPQGESYHSNSSCLSLKRTGRLVEKSQVDSLKHCSRCASRGE